MSVNKVQEFQVQANAHPLHMHINHMQLTTVDGGGWGGWHQEGDFLDTFLGSGTVRFITDKFKGDVIMHCHLLVHEDFGCMTQMVIVEDKTKQPWGYCLHGDPIAGIAAMSMSSVSACLACLLAVLYSGRLQRFFPTRSCGRDGIIMGLELQSFGAKASYFMLPLFIVSILPLVNDDGYSGGLVAALHANEASYIAFLPVHIVSLLLVLGAAVWLLWARWIKADLRVVSDGKSREIAMAPVATTASSAAAAAAAAAVAIANDDADAVNLFKDECEREMLVERSL